jgi:hypothetical protein
MGESSDKDMIGLSIMISSILGLGSDAVDAGVGDDVIDGGTGLNFLT